MGTSNLQLINVAIDLSIFTFYCICKDEIHQCLINNTYIYIYNCKF